MLVVLIENLTLFHRRGSGYNFVIPDGVPHAFGLVPLVALSGNTSAATHDSHSSRRGRVGRSVGVARGLVDLGKHPRVAIGSNCRRGIVSRSERAVIEDFKPEKFTDRDCVVVLDTGTWNRGVRRLAQRDRNCRASWSIITRPRTTSAGYGWWTSNRSRPADWREIIQAARAKISPAVANHLFMAMATDTGWFRHPNAKPRTFALAAELVTLGANPTVLYEQLYESAPLARLRLAGRALERLEVRAGGTLAFMEIYLGDYATTGAVPGDTEDLINYPRSVEGVEVGLLFIEQPDGGTKVSFRARSLDVSMLAEQFGGGGHKLASGARTNDPLAQTRDAVLKAVEAALRGKP